MHINKTYKILTAIFIVLSIVILATVDKSNSVYLGIAIRFVVILYLIRLTYGIAMYVREKYKKQKYSYNIVLNLGLMIFVVINILRQIELLVHNFHSTNIVEFYNNSLESFSFFASLTLPCIITLSIYCVITNIILIKKERFRVQNVLGIVFGIVLIFCVLSSQTVYKYTKHVFKDNSQLLVKRFVDISVNVVLSYFYCLILSTLYCNIKAARHKPKYDKDFVVILGARVRKDGTLTPLLQGRVDKALEFARNQKNEANKDIVFIPSGGKGADEVISEAEAIRNYLLDKGIDKQNIIIENKSSSTNENMRFSKKEIDKINNNGKIVFSTSNYHVFRSGVIATECGKIVKVLVALLNGIFIQMH